ncbi:hypothetical protein WMY93_000827 [Mugilogobius chulae]|uniref:Cilia- and flagella-associated protein 410 n=1 Tax=Mugilogobius chulae TaxID=88201 RepID=A0AAW0Q0D7_9GOBI
MKLSRKLVLAKAKASDLESVKKLNCWGCTLTDISIFTQMPNIEVLTLSVNSITSLAPLAGCLNLCELYLRRNMISSLSELSYLRCLSRLKVLWLAENPCCGTDPNLYRLTVLRCLPRLQKLDNQLVTEEEVALALTQGEEVIPPQSQSKTSLQPTVTKTLRHKIREELGMRRLPRDKFPSLSSPSTRENRPLIRKSHTLDAILLLLKDLEEDELLVVNTATQNRLQMFTLNSEMMKNSLQTQRTEDIEN